jgi:hypothetical protein
METEAELQVGEIHIQPKNIHEMSLNGTIAIAKDRQLIELQDTIVVQIEEIARVKNQI